MEKNKKFLVSRLFVIAMTLLISLPLIGQNQVVTIGKNELPFSDGLFWITEFSDGQTRIAGKQGIIEITGRKARLFNLRDTINNISHDQNIQSRLIEGQNGSIWTTTPSALHRFYPRTGKTVTKQFLWNGRRLTSNYRIITVDEEKSTLWIQAEDFIWEYNSIQEKIKPIASSVKSIYFAVNPQRTKIVGTTYKNTIQVFSLGLNTENKFSNRTVTLPIRQSTVPTFQEDNNDIAWIGSDQGLFRIDLNKDSIEVQTRLDSVAINSIICDKEGTLWLATIGNGVLQYDIENDKILHQFSIEDNLLGDSPNYVSKGRDGVVWVSFTNKGINAIIPNLNRFTSPGPVTFSAPISDMVLTSNHVPLIIENFGGLWRKKEGQDWNRDSKNYRGNNRRPFKAKFNKLSDEIWLTSNVNLAKVEEDETPWKFISWPTRFVKDIITDGKNQFLASGRQGLEIITIEKDVINIAAESSFGNLDTENITGLYQIKSGRALLAYQDQEAWLCRKQGASWQIQHRIPLMGSINAVVKASDSLLYVGASTGLHEISPEGTINQLLADHPSLMNRPIESIIEDSKGFLWLGTQNGLIRYQPTTKEVRLFTEADGLPTNEFLDIKPIIFPEGNIWMATNEGIVGFDPGSLQLTEAQSQPILTRIRINEIPHQDTLRPAYLTNLSTTYVRNDLDFQIATTELENSPLSAVEYQLVGHDRSLRRAESGQTIVYSNLPHGEYTFTYSAIDRHGLRSSPKRLSVTISPPFTQTWTFYLLVALGTALLLAGTYIFLVRQERLKQLRRQQQQARIAAERDRIAGEVHDDLGGQLSSIMYLSEELLLTEAVPGTERELQRIHELSRGSLQNVRDIIFALDNRRSTLANLGDQLRGAGTEFFKDRKVQYDHQEQLSKPDFVLSSRQKRDLTLVVKEAWHNIAKHAHADKVTVSLKQQEEGPLVLTVSDDGKGFSSPKSANGTGGYGLDNMREKATSIGGSLSITSIPKEGTTLTLKWSLPEESLP